jgi:hypothetical protein
MIKYSEYEQEAIKVTLPVIEQTVLVNLNRTLLFESFQNSLVTYRHCLSAAFLGCNTAYRLPHLASYAHALVGPL